MPDTFAPPAPNPSDIDALVDLIFGYLDGLVPVRLLSEKGPPPKTPVSRFVKVAQLSEGLASLSENAASEARAVFVVPGTVATAGSARASDIRQSGVVLVDLDTGDLDVQQNHFETCLGVPSMVVASGGTTPEGQAKRHLYWRLTEAATGPDLDRVRRLRETIAARVGGDRSFASLHQPIRVAGTIHGKNGLMTPVRILTRSRREYELDDLEAAIQTLPALAEASDDGLQRPLNLGAATRVTAAELSRRPIRSEGQDGITRFDALSCVIGHWLRTVRLGRCDLEEAWSAVRDHNAAMITPPWDEKWLQREFDALLKRDVQEKGPISDKQEIASPGAVAADGTVEPPPSSEDALAARFVELHGDDWRYVGAWGAWFHWTGTRWQRDETGLVRETARLVCRANAAKADKPGEARRIASDKVISALLRIAATDPAVATRPQDWDAHPMLLNTPEGVIDLATGETHDHDPARLITQQTAAAPAGGCDRWKAFLNEITDGDRDLQAYLARFAGYCLTGSTSEQVFAFLVGSGANGKSVFLQTIAAVLGDYAATATLDTFMTSKASRHLTELAGLRAARLVIVPETEPDRAWAEGRIKMVTGGERIRANFMYRDHFEYTSRFKLVVMGNHRPALSGVGEAMRRRMHLVPFSVTIPQERREHALAERLREEGPGILAWMLEGCAEWQRKGLAPTKEMRAAADAYFEAEDVVGQWIAETCVLDPRAKAQSRTLYASWSAWATAAGHLPGSQKTLGEALRARGLRDAKVNRARGWFGIGLKACPPQARSFE